MDVPDWTIGIAVLEPDHALVVLRGRIGAAAVADIRRRVDELLAGGVRFVVLDLAHVELCATRMFTVVAQAHRWLRARGGWLRLVAVNPRVAAALDAVELPALFTLYREATREISDVS